MSRSEMRLNLTTDTRNNPPAELRLVDRSGVAHTYRLGGSTVRASVWSYDWAGAVESCIRPSSEEGISAPG